jgi:ubiquinone/menaquinone biosynthesis C-methylase UbiE
MRDATTVTTTTEYTLADQERMKAAQNYFKWQASLAEQQLGRRVLEVGCGIGNFSEHLWDRERVVGIDIDENCVSCWRERFAGRRQYSDFTLNAEDPVFLALKDEQIDSIACVNVLEHIEKHDLVLRQMNSILPVGGTVILIVPAFEALYGEIDLRLGHFRRYTRRSLRQLAETTGFRPRVLQFMNTVGFVGWWANAKLFKRFEQSEDQIKFFDSYIVPVMSRVEGWIAPPFGQSLLAVLEKR